ncbi:hypothetical protein HNQ07_003185 [Deinococcus metalli]|uniref:Uncharacterized protein n=1 Tax=Deinococcus metalli TaxID=1141878 RepID=A0A7W8KIL8_9DEIO|nr:hypothetical protein [Deinococcus metalli]MBB5377686.1 hypothetical protein [Deinococcus metalli]GHF52550.1 hypothetical protein GCM10017781_31140 [Deinococcus metalli]
MRAALRALSLGLWLLMAVPAGATTAPTLTFAQQAKKAEVIVRATLGTAATVTEGGAAYTVYPLTVAETLTGDAGTLPQYQGRPALYVLQGLADLPTLTAGQEVVALLYARRLDSPVVGFNQGLYPVSSGKVTGAKDAAGKDITDLGALRDAIRAAREAK